MGWARCFQASYPICIQILFNAYTWSASGQVLDQTEYHKNVKPFESHEASLLRNFYVN